MNGLRRRIDLVALLLVSMSSVTLASKFVPFINNMLLGRTFDLSKSEVGNDIISEAERQKAFKVDNKRSDIKYKMIKSSQDVRDVLDVSGQLSLKVMAGRVNVEGKGSYLKSSIDSESSLEVMVQVYYKTVTKTLHDTMTLLSDWDSNGVTGQHYIRSLTYGGYLIASFKYHTSNEEEKEDIKASVSVEVNTVKAEVGVKGLFNKLSSLAKSQTSLTISYTSSIISDKVPVDLETLMKVIDDFNGELAKINNGEGVPLMAEIRELSFLQMNNAAREKLKFLKNSVLTQQMEILASMFHDLKVTSDALSDAVEDVDMTVEQEGKYGEFNYRLTQISDKFYKAIQDLDLNSKTGSATQFREAIDAYKEGKTAFLPGKFLREFQKFKKENPVGDSELNEIRNKLVNLRDKVGTLDLRFSAGESAIAYPQSGNAAYMITKGAPEMSSIMVCFSSRSLTTKASQTYFSYSAPSANNAFKVASDENGKMIVFRGSSQLKFEGTTKRPLNADDREWHSWCFYWDDSGMTIVYKDTREIGAKSGLAAGQKIPAGGTWIVGNEQVGNAINSAAPFKGEITNVNVYGNFAKTEFQTSVILRVTSKTCKPSIYKNIIKSWDDFKIGFVGDLKVLSKNFCT